MFLVRQASQKNVDAIVDIVRGVYDEYGFSWDAEGYHADLYDPEGAYWRRDGGFWICQSLVDDDAYYGVVGLESFPPIPLGEPLQTVDGTLRVAGADCSLERLYVRQSARGMGVGSTLLEHVVETARERGFRRMEIWSDKRFEAAHKLYQRFGAEVVGERICDDPDESPEWGLVLPLRNEKNL